MTNTPEETKEVFNPKDWVALSKDFHPKHKIQFAYNQRKKYGSPVCWLEKDGLFAVGIPRKERETRASLKRYNAVYKRSILELI